VLFALEEAEDLSLVKTLYLDGLTNFNDVLDTQRALFDQQDLHVESQGQVTKNLISLYKALGGGWNPGSAQKEEVGDKVDE
jgi:multidrug efflux system outer membrane protein